MSADAWKSCPICLGVPERLRGGYEHLYGKVSEEEYNRKKSECESEKNDMPVRVDYEYTILQKGGAVFLSFYAKCEVCGAEWKHQGLL